MSLQNSTREKRDNRHAEKNWADQAERLAHALPLLLERGRNRLARLQPLRARGAELDRAIPRRALCWGRDRMAKIRVEMRGAAIPMDRDLLLDRVRLCDRHVIPTTSARRFSRPGSSKSGRSRRIM